MSFRDQLADRLEAADQERVASFVRRLTPWKLGLFGALVGVLIAGTIAFGWYRGQKRESRLSRATVAAEVSGNLRRLERPGGGALHQDAWMRCITTPDGAPALVVPDTRPLNGSLCRRRASAEASGRLGPSALRLLDEICADQERLHVLFVQATEMDTTADRPLAAAPDSTAADSTRTNGAAGTGTPPPCATLAEVVALEERLITNYRAALKKLSDR